MKTKGLHSANNNSAFKAETSDYTNEKTC